jgi:hypothetical protein
MCDDRCVFMLEYAPADAMAEKRSAGGSQYLAGNRGPHRSGCAIPTVKPTILHPGLGNPSIVVG